MTKYGLTSIDPGTDGNVLTSDGTDWTSEAAAGGGGAAVYDITAGTGGDYATLELALAAITTGQTLFIIDAVTMAADVTCTVSDITIIGKSRSSSVVTQGAYDINFSGTGITLESLKFTKAGGNIVFTDTSTDASHLVTNCHIEVTASTTYPLKIDGDNSIVSNCLFTGTTAVANFIYATGERIDIIGCNFNTGSNTMDAISLVGQYGNVTGCQMYCTGSNATFIESSGYYSTITGNVASVNSGSGSNFIQTGRNATIVGNVTLGFGRVFVALDDCIIANNYIQLVGFAEAFYGLTERCTISGNVIEGTTLNGNIAFPDALVECVVSGNTFKSIATGIAFASTSADNVVTGNRFDEDVTTPMSGDQYLDEASNIIQDNHGVSNRWNHELAFMENQSGGTINKGEVVIRKLTAESDEVTTTTTAGDPLVFGIAQEEILDTAMGKIIVSGGIENNVKVDGTTDIAVGDLLTTFTTAGIMAKATTGDTAIAIARTAYTTDDSNGLIKVVVIKPQLVA